MRDYRVLIFKLIFGALVLLGLISCRLVTSQSPRQSVLLVVVDRLGARTVNCSGDWPGFNSFCDAGVRFSRLFTNSTMSAPSLASLLTGLYPYENQFRFAGSGPQGFLSSQFETLSEMAMKRGYHTAFFAGSLPMIKRTGIQQGFEVFDDAWGDRDRIPLFMRPARQGVERYLKWRMENMGEETFSVLHFGDLQYPWISSLDEAGRSRENSTNGQLQEIDSALANLKRGLEQKKLWDSTTILVVGLSGESAMDQFAREGEIPANDLHSSAVQVFGVFKLGQGAFGSRYKWAPLSWSFDAAVSSIDLAATLADLIEAKLKVPDDRPDEIRAEALSQWLAGPSQEYDQWRKKDRLILTESAWARWNLGNSYSIRASLRKAGLTFIFDRTPMVYVTHSDFYEESPISVKDPEFSNLTDGPSRLLREIGFKSSDSIATIEIIKDRFLRARFTRRLGGNSEELSPSDQHLIEIYLSQLRNPKNQNRNEGRDFLFWKDLTAWELGHFVSPRTPCVEAVFSKEVRETDEEDLKIKTLCGTLEASWVRRWLIAKSEADKTHALDVLARMDKQRLTAVRFAEMNLATGRNWESGNTRKEKFEPLEVLLTQPESQKLQMQLMRRLKAGAEF